MKTLYSCVAAVLIPCIAFGGMWLSGPGKGYHAAAAGGASVTLDTSVKDGGSFSGGGFTTLDLTITVASNSNRALFVLVCGGGTTGAEDVTSVTSSVNGALTDLGTATDGNFVYVSAWRLTNPTAGAHTITVLFAGTTTSHCEIFAVSLYNVDQTTPNDTLVTGGSSTGTAPTASATLASTDMGIAAMMTDDETGIAVTAGSQLQETENIGGGGDTAASMANRTGSGSVAITWSQDSNGWAVGYIPVNSTP